MKYSNSYNHICPLKNIWVNYYSIIIFVCLLMPFQTANASSKEIVFMDQKKNPIQGVVASIVADRDSTLLRVEVSDNAGHVTLSDSILSHSMLIINYPGLKSLTLRPAEYGDSIILQPSAIELNEIVVTGKDMVKAEAGKIIFTPGDLRNRVINAYDLLVNVPLLSGRDGTLKVMSKDVHILINGREPNVPQKQVITELQSLEPGIIKSVEVIPFSGSAYSASGNFGVVNIILKDRGNGTWLSINARGSGGARGATASESVDLYYTHNRFRLSIGEEFLYNDLRTKTDEEFLYNQESASDFISIKNKARSSSSTFQPFGYLHLSYQLSKRSVIGGGLTIYSDKMKQTYTAKSIFTKESNIPEVTESRSLFTQPWTKPKTYYQLFYTLDTDKKGSQLQLSGLYRNDSASSEVVYDFSPEMNEERDENGKGGSISAKYKQVFNDRQILSGGYAFRTTRRRDASDSELQSYRFTYSETINAAFLELNSRWSNVLSSNIGLRLENSRISGIFTADNDNFRRSETDLFPSLSINLSFPESYNFVIFNLSRSIFRPQFVDLNPYVLWTSSNTCRMGNPNLKSSKDWTVSALYMFRGDFMLYLSFSRYKNSNNPFLYGENGISYTTRINRPRTDIYSLMFEYNKSISKIWRLRLNVDASYYDSPFQYNGVDLSFHSLSSWLTFRNRITIPGKYTPVLDIDGQFGYSTQLYDSGANWIANISIDASKQLFENFQIGIGLDSELERLINSKMSLPDFQRIIRFTAVPLRGRISVSYTFGNQKIRYFEDKTDTSYNSRF